MPQLARFVDPGDEVIVLTVLVSYSPIVQLNYCCAGARRTSSAGQFHVTEAFAPTCYAAHEADDDLRPKQPHRARQLTRPSQDEMICT